MQRWLQEAVTLGESEKTGEAWQTYGEYEIAKSLRCSAIDLKGHRSNCWLKTEAGKDKFITTNDVHTFCICCMFLNVVCSFIKKN